MFINEPAGIFFVAPSLESLKIIENINLIMMLNDPVGFLSFVPTVASICAVFKFGFLLLVIGFAAIAGIVLLIRKLQSKSPVFSLF